MDRRPNLDRLADHLRVLGNRNRLQLLYELRSPATVDDLELQPERVAQGENPDRSISHQAVRDHLSKLRSIDVITIERQTREGHIVDFHVLNHQRLFAIVEELRALGELRAEHPPPEEQTIRAERGTEPDAPDGPRLIVVRGQREGQVFPLRGEARSGDRGWIIGRKRGLAVSLDYDPFTSAENSEILMDGSGLKLVDLPTSRNGTFLNFEKLPPGGSAPLRHGDIVGVGRTNLVFRSAKG